MGLRSRAVVFLYTNMKELGENMKALAYKKLKPYAKSALVGLISYTNLFPKNPIIEVILKILPMVTLVIFLNNMSKIKAYNNSSTQYLIAGMFFSIIGDICLCSPLWDPLGNPEDRYGDTMFLPGVGAFAVGHLFYIQAFGLKWDNTAL